MAASAFDAARKGANEWVVGPGSDAEALLGVTAERGRAAELLRAAAARVLELMGPSVAQRARESARLQPVEDAVRSLLARMPAPAPESVEELAPTDLASLELPALAEGAGSATARLEQRWAAYQGARERERGLELDCGGGSLWQPVDGTALAAWQDASGARRDAARALSPLLAAVEGEHGALGARLVGLAHSLAAWCARAVAEGRAALAREEASAEHTLGRAQALLATTESFLEAQVGALSGGLQAAGCYC